MRNMQKDFLLDLIGSDGDFFRCVADYPNCTLGDKILCLENMITTFGSTIYDFLDTVYLPEQDKLEEELAFIRSLKMINDLCFNREIVTSDSRTIPALDYYFSRLSSDPIDPHIFRRKIKSIILQGIEQIEAADLEVEQRSQMPRTYKIKRPGWRIALNLPQNRQLYLYGFLSEKEFSVLDKKTKETINYQRHNIKLFMQFYSFGFYDFVEYINKKGFEPSLSKNGLEIFLSQLGSLLHFTRNHDLNLSNFNFDEKIWLFKYVPHIIDFFDSKSVNWGWLDSLEEDVLNFILKLVEYTTNFFYAPLKGIISLEPSHRKQSVRHCYFIKKELRLDAVEILKKGPQCLFLFVENADQVKFLRDSLWCGEILCLDFETLNFLLPNRNFCESYIELIKSGFFSFDEYCCLDAHLRAEIILQFQKLEKLKLMGGVKNLSEIFSLPLESRLTLYDCPYLDEICFLLRNQVPLHEIVLFSRNFLQDFFGTHGMYLKIIEQYPYCDLATKILFLRRADDESTFEFLAHLDKLYQPKRDKERERDELNFIFAFKRIHDFCLSGKALSADDHPLGEMRKNILEKTVQLNAFQKTRKKRKKREALESQKVSRPGWRLAWNLPSENQLFLYGFMSEKKFNSLAEEDRDLIEIRKEKIKIFMKMWSVGMEDFFLNFFALRRNLGSIDLEPFLLAIYRMEIFANDCRIDVALLSMEQRILFMSCFEDSRGKTLLSLDEKYIAQLSESSKAIRQKDSETVLKLIREEALSPPTLSQLSLSQMSLFSVRKKEEEKPCDDLRARPLH